ncbi:hypothetical protein, partial [Mycobacterium colombiense]|uniref:hypothetical protein n=1 Tax=Mycobacterium colombiense TaxID=339268 RepID=UPI001E313A7A
LEELRQTRRQLAVIRPFGLDIVESQWSPVSCTRQQLRPMLQPGLSPIACRIVALGGYGSEKRDTSEPISASAF